ncbi:MAG: DUF4212 domain-containing protein [Rhodocyclaceae bacterium]
MNDAQEHERPPTPVRLSARQRAYWRRTLALTGGLLAIWFCATFAAAYFATELNRFSFLGIPFAYYFFSQGALIVFLIIIAFYVWAMNRLDQRFGVGERR